jgi:putative salt-induced outer membrane protein
MLLFLTGTSVSAEPLPDAVAEMLRAASPAQLSVVADLAKKTQPNSIEEIEDLVAAITESRAAAEQTEVASRGPLDGWVGEGSLGGSFTTGNTSERGVAASIALSKKAGDWKHDFKARADYQQSDGIKTRERYLTSYQGNVSFTPQLYSYGLLQWERDKFAGYGLRFTESLGLGWIAFDDPAVRLALEGGIALRQTRFMIGMDENELNSRGKLDFRWTLSPGVVFTEEAGFLLGGEDGTLFSNGALTSSLFADLSARLSFDVLHEISPAAGRESTDTITRLSLVYNF